ncbi:MAG: ATP-binding protein [Chloroflexi bacterium]|nr:ATP-binding protein [Chloroflexota bacterium]
MNTSTNPHGRYLGNVVGGSLNRGIEVRLDPQVPVEEMALGQHVVIQGQSRRFFGIITDITLETSDDSVRANPPDLSNPLVASVVSSTAVYATLQVLPMLALEGEMALIDGPMPAKTVPPHFAPVHLAAKEDVEMVFGREDERHFWVGTPLDLEERINIDLEEFVKRSNGVFGKSGTGKTFLTRLLLVGILQKSAAVNLVFDMQSEYGWMGTSEGTGTVKGLKQLFPSKVAVFSLDEEHGRRRGISPDYLVKVGYNQIEPEDIEMLRETLNLSEVAADAAFTVAGHFGQQRWLRQFLDLDGQEVQELSKSINVNERALSTLHNRLRRLSRFHFVTERETDESVEEILRYLDRGIHVVLEFGRYQNELAAYILVANLLTRRIHSRYVTRKEEAMGDQAKEPRPLVITIEEAHRFLSPGIASQTIFGTIAREMRKYNVTLLVVDQRPSGIDDEVMSQLGTKLSCLLDNERDVDAVMSGVSGARELRSVLSKLDSKQESLIFGHAVPMPIVVRVRDYGTNESYRELGFQEASELRQQMERDADDLFGGR